MRWKALFFAVFVAACGGAGEEAVPEPSAVEAQRVNGSLAEIVEAIYIQTNVTALGAAIVHADGRIEIAVAGERTRGSGDYVQPGDLWHLGSNTKSMTALLYADLVQQGTLKWGATLPELFPSHADKIHQNWAKVTIEDLLTHTSGVADVDISWLRKAHTSKLSEQDQRAEAVVEFLSEPPVFPVGKFQYANLNYILAGAAIEQATGESWEDLMRAGSPGALMGQSGWGYGPPQGSQPQGHYFKGLAATPAGQAWMGADNPKALGPAGTVHASLRSWGEYARAFLPGSGIMPEATRKKLTDKSYGDYALGWAIYEDPKWGHMLQHAGSNTMWLAQIIVLPEKDVALLVTTNEAGIAADLAVRETTKAIGKLALQDN